jgi:outer membrane lipoprotein-sorting protein
MRHRLAPLAALAAALAAPPLLAPPRPVRADGDARALVERAIEKNAGNDEQGTMTWLLVAKDGSERRLRLVFRAKRGESGRRMLLLRFLEPREIRRTALLGLSGGGKADAQWVYLPDLRKTKRVAAADGAERFLGSDFCYEDLRPDDVDANAYEAVGRERVGLDECEIVEATPRPERAVATAYAKRRIWIRKSDAVPLKTVFFAKDGTPWKTLTAQDLTTVDGFVRPGRLEMRDEKAGTKTLVTVEDRRINAGIPDRVFSERELEEGD